MNNIAWLRLIFILFCIVLAGGTAYFFSTHDVGEIDIFSDMMVVISIFSGVLIAVITIFADVPESGTIKTILLRNATVRPKLTRVYILFHFYLVSITLMLACKILLPVLGKDEDGYLLLKRIALTFGVFVVMLSFGLPKIIADALHEKKKSA